ncbi:MAG: hypothetical protein WD672_04240 [Woeseia sp.]
MTDAHARSATPGDAATAREAAAMNRRLLELAAEDKWQHLEGIMTRRNKLLASISGAEREHALLAARHCTERLQAMAQVAKSRCAEQLAALKHGRKAAESYRANR